MKVRGGQNRFAANVTLPAVSLCPCRGSVKWMCALNSVMHLKGKEEKGYFRKLDSTSKEKEE